MDRIDASILRKGIYGAYKNLDENKELVNSLNVFPVPDGDTGINMFLTMKSVVNKLEDSENTVADVSKALGMGSLMGARGNSGVILSQLCRGVTSVFENKEVITIDDIADAALAAKETAYKAVLKPTEGTILTVSRMIADYAQSEKDNFKRVDKFLEALIIEGHRALDMTPDMLPVLKEAGVVDAGGKGLLILLEGFLSGITNKNIVFESKKINVKDNLHEHISHDNLKSEDIKFGYCTEFLIKTDGSKDYLDFRKSIEENGDSIVVVGAEDIIKAHIHTNDPGLVLQKALEQGYLIDIKIDNMRVQHEHRIATDAQVEAAQKVEEKEKKKFGFVTVSIGEGFNSIFSDLGVDEIISGGQTMNPSTEDIVAAINKINSENIFILPNNKNIILSAKQAVDLVDRNVKVIETKSIPEAFTAMINFDEGLDLDSNYENMSESISEVLTLQLTYAVRDTKIGDLEISKGDLIGLKGNDIVVRGKKIEETMYDLVKKSIDDDSSLITIYYGNEADKVKSEKLLEKLEEKFDDMDIELVYGGQPLYYYIASIE